MGMRSQSLAYFNILGTVGFRTGYWFNTLHDTIQETP